MDRDESGCLEVETKVVRARDWERSRSPPPESAAQRTPKEVLHQIIILLRPSFSVHHQSNLGIWVFNARQYDFSVYLSNMRAFLLLRLVSRTWNYVVAAIAYREFVIPTRFPANKSSPRGKVRQGGSSASGSSWSISAGVNTPSGRVTKTIPCKGAVTVRKLVSFLNTLPHPSTSSNSSSSDSNSTLQCSLPTNIRSLILFDFCHPFGPNSYSHQQQLMNSIISKFANSDIRSLHCYGREAYAFPRGNWVKDNLPRLPSTIENLSFDAVDRRTISYGLLTLGPYIKSLEIRNRSRISDFDYFGNPGEVFELPEEMPHLKTLRLANVSATVDEFRRIFQKIGGKKGGTPGKGGGGVWTSTLQSLTAVQLFALNDEPPALTAPLTDQDFLNLISIHGISLTLTHLWIEPGVPYASEFFSIWRPEIVTEIVKHCPRLITFGYTSYIDETLVDHLPGGLKRLSLALRPALRLVTANSYLQSYGRFTEFVERMLEKGEVKLDSFTVLLNGQLQQNPGFWRMSFEEVGELFEVGKAELESTCKSSGIELSFEMV
ncbi:hypothetical protein CC2G_009895 [Coprinopsis cinerea AmutBmut pab1-1]|nr:hypothetical protein CC2G_009895 [Coprinopsis cinerea AmutBmut pab1-1]